MHTACNLTSRILLATAAPAAYASCRIAPAPTDAYGSTYRYVRVCPDGTGRYRISAINADGSTELTVLDATTGRPVPLTGIPAGQNFIPGQGAYDRFDHSSKGWALCTNNTWRVTDALELTFGLRYRDDTKKLFAQYRTTPPGLAAAVLRYWAKTFLVSSL